jgi:hypothetical protein
MVLAYLDSRKQKQGEAGYQYPYEYNAPDIHYNTGVGLKVVNKHLRMLKLRGALELIMDTDDKPSRTRMGALKYRVVKGAYEREWGPGSRGANVLNEGHSAPSVNAGQSEPGVESRAISAHREGHSAPCVEPEAGLSRTAVEALRSGHSAPTNDNERIREEKSCKKREDGSGSTSSSPPLNAPASASAPPAQKPGERVSKEERLRSSEGSHSGSGKSSAPSAAPNPDPIDPVYGIPVSYVRRYEKHVDALNSFLKDNEQVRQRIERGSDAEAGKIIIQLLDTLQLD